MDRSNGTGSRFPAPIFTKRKPRQALFAHPNNTTNATGDAFGSYAPRPRASGCAPGSRAPLGNNAIIRPTVNRATSPHEGDNQPLYNRPRAPNLQNPVRNQMMGGKPLTRPGYPPNIPRTGGFKADTRMCTSTSIKDQDTSGYTQNSSTNRRPMNPQKRSYDSTSGPDPKPSGLQMPSYQQNNQNSQPYGYQPAKRPNTPQPWDSDPWKTNPGTQYPNATIPSSKKQNTRGSDQRPTVQKYGQMPWGSPDKPDYNTRDQPLAGSSQAGTRNSTPLKDVTNTTPSRSKSSAVDKRQQLTARFITSTIEGLKHWSQYADKLPLFFEIFGILYSAVSVGTENVSVSFILKDDRDTINCIFYQIDRELPRLIRGRTYRCVGQLLGNQGAFRCISVRQAMSPQEIKPSRLVSSSDRAMRSVVAKLTEM